MRLYFGGEITSGAAEEFVTALARHKGPVTLELFSPGGSVRAAVHAAQAIVDHGNVTVYVSSLAGSAAFLLAVAGKKLLMGPGALFMLHETSAFIIFDNQTKKKMTTNIEWLDKEDESVLSFITTHTALAIETVRGWLTKDTWFAAVDMVKMQLGEITKRQARKQSTDGLRTIRRYYGDPFFMRAKALLEDKMGKEVIIDDDNDDEKVDPTVEDKGRGDPEEYTISAPGAKLLFRDGTVAVAVTEDTLKNLTKERDDAVASRDMTAAKLMAHEAKQHKAEAEALIEYGEAQGYLTPAQRPEWLQLAMKDLDGARALMKVQPKSPFLKELGSTQAVSVIPPEERRLLAEGFLTEDQLKKLAAARENG